MDLLAYLQSSPTDALSVYSNPRSNSSDVSAPITPLSLSDGESAYGGAPPDLAFSDYVAAFTHAGSAEPDAFPVVDELGEHSFPDGGMQAAFGGGMEDAFRPKSAPEALGAGWDVSMDDETPRAGGERKLSDIGRLMADVVLGAEAS
ncbi:hypothetical protein C2E23DRAFT_723414 [Lenzites betulinus]|nr:hypothetical protein C2E23DRAFT_723414 [Lenzites betulinus]